MTEAPDDVRATSPPSYIDVCRYGTTRWWHAFLTPFGWRPRVVTEVEGRIEIAKEKP